MLFIARPGATTLLVLMLSLLTVSLTQAADEVVRIDTRPGVSQPFLVLAPSGPVAGAVIMFPPEDGHAKFKLRENGSYKIKHGGWIGQTAARYLGQGYGVAVIQPPSDIDGMDPAFRKSAAHAEDLRHVIKYIRARFGHRPFLMGTCRASHSASSVASKVDNVTIAGIVLASSRSRGKRGSILDLIRPGEVKTRVLFIHHVDDDCGGSPHTGVAGLAEAFSAAEVATVSVSGGWRKPDAKKQKRGCGTNGSHKFYGAHGPVVDTITRWMRGGAVDEFLDAGS